MPASDNWESDLRPLREVEVQSDKTVKSFVGGGHAFFGEKELIYQDVSSGTPREVENRLRKAGGQKHTTKKWKARVPVSADKNVAGYLRHLRHDLHLELWDFSAPREQPSAATGSIASPPGHPTLSHVPVYNLAPWSLGPAGAPRPWSLGAVNSPGVTTPGDRAAADSSGAGGDASPVRLAVLDTGVPRNYSTLHPQLAHAVAEKPDYEDPMQSGGQLRLDAGHGLFILDLVVGLRPELAPVCMRRPLRNDSNLTLGEHLIGLDLWEVTQDVLRDDTPLIVNMSFAAYAAHDTPGLGLVRELAWMADEGYNVLVVAAAGNTGDDRKCFPAACGLPNVVSVGALDGKDGTKVASFSSRGDWVDCWTNGVDIAAGYLSGIYDHPPKHPEEFPVDDPWALWSGTSFAAPRVAAAIAAKAATMPGASLSAVWDALRYQNRDRHPQSTDPSGDTSTEKGVII